MADKILKFQASWCGPCQQLAMTLKGEDLGVEVEDVDIDKFPEVAVKYHVRSVPTLVYLRSEREIGRKIGGGSLQEVKDWLSLTSEGK